MELNKLTIIPVDDAKNPQIFIDYIKDGEIVSDRGVAALSISTLENLSTFVSVQGEASYIVTYLIENFLANGEMSKLIIQSIAMAIATSNEGELASIYHNLNNLLDLVGKRYDELKFPV